MPAAVAAPRCAKAAVILDQIGRREAGELHPMSELVAGDDLGELGQEDLARAEREGASAGQIDQPARWAGQRCRT